MTIKKFLVTIDDCQLEAYDEARTLVGSTNRSEHIRALLEKFTQATGTAWPDANYELGVAKINRNRRAKED